MLSALRARGERLTSRPLTLSAHAIGRAGRVFLLALTLGLTASHRTSTAVGWWFGLVGLATVATSIPAQHRGLGRIGRVVEALGTAVAIVMTSGEAASSVSPFFPYLVAPALGAGLARGIEGAIVIPGFEAAGLVAGSLLENVGRGGQFSQNAAEWVSFALIAGGAGAFIHRLLTPEEAPASETSYVAAYRLLSQLRPVARELSVGLDPTTIAQTVLADLRDVVPFKLGAVLARTGGDRLTTLAHVGADRAPEWEVRITDEDTAFAEAWFSQRPVLRNRQFDATKAGTAAVLPLTIGLRTFGLVAVESPIQHAFTSEHVGRATELLSVAGLRLETALLFDEVRGLATVEERRRLAREIHDGIAQELTSIGYVVDDLTFQAKERVASELEDGLRQLRGEITRIVSELRLSIFDLRSEVDTHGGLGAALSEYVRSVGRNSDFTVHLSLREADTRLAGDAEAELLRIAQEAITNARKHAGAENLWVTLEVVPPRATLRVEDDGKGIRGKRVDSYGMEIMKERADRLRGQLHVGARAGGGTLVEVRIGSDERVSLSSADRASGG